MSFMNVCLWSQIDQALAVYVSEWADQTKDTKWGDGKNEKLKLNVQ